MVTSGKVAEELLKTFTSMGLPKEILTDQGNSFIAQMFKDCAMLTIRLLSTTIYHPQTDRLLKGSPEPLKVCLRKLLDKIRRDGISY